ncbi:helix-turn-helix domain-containing protein [Fusobacterium polymorphum]|jgi:dTDP-4-dehydrorhamnose reductase|uniref:helix-turn-helix domain-containing protein n=1 Tax=Fusobacterium nucleatum subsp. polymorphum TaxID=76857 RepID=UPI0030CFA0B0
MLDNNIKVGNFYNNIGAGRKSGYEVAKKILEEMYKKDEEVQVSKLAKQLRVTYSTGRNYLLRFLEEELGVTTNLKYYNYKK